MYGKTEMLSYLSQNKNKSTSLIIKNFNLCITMAFFFI